MPAKTMTRKALNPDVYVSLFRDALPIPQKPKPTIDA